MSEAPRESWLKFTPAATVAVMLIIFACGGLLGYLWGYRNANVVTMDLCHDLRGVCQKSLSGDRDARELFTTLKKHRWLLHAGNATGSLSYKEIIDRVEKEEIEFRLATENSK